MSASVTGELRISSQEKTEAKAAVHEVQGALVEALASSARIQRQNDLLKLETESLKKVVESVASENALNPERTGLLATNAPQFLGHYTAGPAN